MPTLSFSSGTMSQATPFQNRGNGSYASRYSSAFLPQVGPAFSKQSPMSENETAEDSPSPASQADQITISSSEKAKTDHNQANPNVQNVVQKSVQKDAPKNEQKTDEKKAEVGAFGFLFPVMAFIGAPMMLIPSLLGIKKNKDNTLRFEPNKAARGLGNFLFKNSTIGRDTEKAVETRMQKLLTSSYNKGKTTLALGIIPKTVIGIMYGLQAQQPSIILAHLLQLPLVAMIMRGNKGATSLVYAMGGLFTLGFINDVQNGLIRDGKKPGTKEKIREYDMTHFKALFGLHSGLSAGERVGGFFSESWNMLKFSGRDHVITVKRALSQLNKLAHGEQNDLTDLKSTGSTSKSSVGFLLNYASTIPALFSALFLNSESKTAKYFSRYSMATTIMAGLMLDFGMFLVALNGKNWAERVPLVGTSMEMGGTIAGYSPNPWIQSIAIACQQLGGGLNSIFFANKAEKNA